jgi:hypothetical protein
MATTQENPTVTSEKPDTPGTYVPDEVVTEIIGALDDRLGVIKWRNLFDEVHFEEEMYREMMLRACIAAKLSVRLPEKDWSRIADPSESPDLEEFIYLCIPASFHYTPNFTSDTPGYCGTIFHIQWGGGPSYLSNVTRPRIDDAGNKLDYDQGFNCYALDPS